MDGARAGHGGVTAVVGGADGVGAALARRLGTVAPVAVVGCTGREAAVAEAVRAAGGSAIALTADHLDRRAVAAALAAAADLGPLTGVVHAHLDPGTVVPTPVTALSDEAWDRAADVPVRALLVTIQAGAAALSPGGRIVVVVPTLGITGEPGLVAACTAAEAQRTLAKSAARTWGPDGIGVHVVAAELGVLAGSGTGGGLGARPAALPPSTADDVVDAVCTALAHLPTSMTGATLFVDAGVTMLP